MTREGQQRAAEISAVLFGAPPAAFALLARDDAGKLKGDCQPLSSCLAMTMRWIWLVPS